MPRLAAEHAIRTAAVEPFRYWTGGLAYELCRRHGVEVETYERFTAGREGRFPLLSAHQWDAKAIEFGEDLRIILVKGTSKIQRIIWSIVHELGHILLGHEGAALNLATGEYRETTKWCEEEADKFARYVLLPADEMRHFKRERRTATEIAALKGVSYSAVNVRMRTMRRAGEFDPWAGDALDAQGF